MGRTESFLPGRAKAVWDVELAAAALAEDAAVGEEIESAADVAAEEDAPEFVPVELLEAEDDPVADAEPESVGVALVPAVDNP